MRELSISEVIIGVAICGNPAAAKQAEVPICVATAPDSIKKDLRPIRVLNLRESATKKITKAVVIFGRGITLVACFLLVADLRRLGPQILRRSFYFGVALFDADRDHGLLRGGLISAD